MLHVITIRREGEKVAHNHIAADGFTKAFCGVGIPQMILDMWDDPRNPYKGRGNISCSECLSEYNNGRRDGFHEESVPVVSEP